MALNDVRDFYVYYPGHPNYNDNQIIVDERIREIVVKIEMILFSNKGEFIADMNFGADLEFYLWKTNVDQQYIKNIIINQIDTYVPELESNYVVEINLIEGQFQDGLLIDILLDKLAVKAEFLP